MRHKNIPIVRLLIIAEILGFVAAELLPRRAAPQHPNALGLPPDASIIFGIIPRFTPQSFVWERFIYTTGVAVTPPVICMRA